MQSIENFKRKVGIITIENQLSEWVKGNPIHRVTEQLYGECCPDFSCCTGKIADRDIRERFSKAYKEKDEKLVYEILLIFLEEMIINKGLNILIISDTDTIGTA